MNITCPIPQSLLVLSEVKSRRAVRQKGSAVVAPSTQQQSAGLQPLHQPSQGEREGEATKSLGCMKSARSCTASIITGLCCWVCLPIFFIIIAIVFIPDSLMQYLILPRTSFVWLLLACWLKIAQTFHLPVFTS